MLASSKLYSCLTKKYLKTQRKPKELEIMYQNTIYICIFWYSKICWFPMKNADVSRTQGLYHVIHLFFGSSLDKFHLCRKCVIDFRERGHFNPPPLPPVSEQPRKGPFWIGLIHKPPLIFKSNLELALLTILKERGLCK